MGTIGARLQAQILRCPAAWQAHGPCPSFGYELVKACAGLPGRCESAPDSIGFIAIGQEILTECCGDLSAVLLLQEEPGRDDREFLGERDPGS